MEVEKSDGVSLPVIPPVVPVLPPVVSLAGVELDLLDFGAEPGYTRLGNEPGSEAAAEELLRPVPAGSGRKLHVAKSGKKGDEGEIWATGTIMTALKKSHGLVHVAAKALGCKPEVIYSRARRQLRVRKLIRDCRGEVVDIAETKFIQALKKGEAWAIKFALETIGRDRGYGSKADGGIPSVVPGVNVGGDANPQKLIGAILAIKEGRRRRRKGELIVVKPEGKAS